jgi:hypothetical protein
MVQWRNVGKVMAASLVCAPILIVGKYIVENLFLRGLLFGGAYLSAYLVLLRLLRVWDAFEFLRVLICLKKRNVEDARGDQ